MSLQQMHEKLNNIYFILTIDHWKERSDLKVCKQGHIKSIRENNLTRLKITNLTYGKSVALCFPALAMVI